MTINDLFELLKQHNVDFDKDITIAFNDEDGRDFWVEESEFCLFLVTSYDLDREALPKHEFLDEEE